MEAHAAVFVAKCANDADKPIATQVEQLFSWTLAPISSNFFSVSMYLLQFLLLCTVEPVAQNLFQLFPEFMKISCTLYVQHSPYTLYRITQCCKGIFHCN